MKLRHTIFGTIGFMVLFIIPANPFLYIINLVVALVFLYLGKALTFQKR